MRGRFQYIIRRDERQKQGVIIICQLYALVRAVCFLFKIIILNSRFAALRRSPFTPSCKIKCPSDLNTCWKSIKYEYAFYMYLYDVNRKSRISQTVFYTESEKMFVKFALTILILTRILILIRNVAGAHIR